MRPVGLSSLLLLLAFLRPTPGYSPSHRGLESPIYDSNITLDWIPNFSRSTSASTTTTIPETTSTTTTTPETTSTTTATPETASTTTTIPETASTTTATPETASTTTTIPETASTTTTTPETASTTTTIPETASTTTTTPETASTTTTNPKPTSTTTTTTSSSPEPTTPLTTSLDLYLETREELQLVSKVLGDFTTLVDSTAKEEPAVSRSQRGSGRRAHPAVWWQRKATLPRQSVYNFCEEPIDERCHELETLLEMTDDLVNDLMVNVDGWQNSDLEQLQQQRKELNNTYKLASDNEEAFKGAVKEEDFLNAIAEVQKDVEGGYNAVQEKIDELDPPFNPGSVALVAVVGSVGGLMMVAIVGVMLYAAVKKPKAKKLSTAPDGKIKGENIPIDAFVQDRPGSRPTSRMDPYSQAPVPAARKNIYSAPLGPRSEPFYPESMDGRSQSGLRRTDF